MMTVIYQALCACLGLNPSSEEASVLIREMYTEPENAPQIPRNRDVIYYSVEPDSQANEAPPSYSAENPQQSTHQPSVSHFGLYRLLILCYGPNSHAYARQIRSFLYLDGAGFPRSILRQAGIYPMPNPPEPTFLHQPEGNMWRRRTDLTVSLWIKEKDTMTTRRGAITVPPVIRISTN